MLLIGESAMSFAHLVNILTKTFETNILTKTIETN